jgi:hypothetical protein
MSGTIITSADYQQLCDALEPFANYYYTVRRKPDRLAVLQCGDATLTVGDLRAAAEAINRQPVRAIMQKVKV